MTVTSTSNPDDLGAEGERVLELREERLVANKELREVGEVVVRTEIETVPSRLEVDAFREEVEVEHEPVGQAVSSRTETWEEDGELIVPIYEEQLVVTKRLILRERLHVRRIGTNENQVFEDTVRREHVVIDDSQQTRLVHEVYPTDEPSSAADSESRSDSRADHQGEGGFLSKLVSRALE